MEYFDDSILQPPEREAPLSVRLDAADKLCTAWARNGLGWQTDVTESRLAGCVNVTLYYGSSTYDTAQMSRLIELAVQDCRALGIETATPADLALLLDRWEAK